MIDLRPVKPARSWSMGTTLSLGKSQRAKALE